jgi:hypothetical protein
MLEDRSTVTNVRVSELLEEMAPLPAREFMQDKTWREIAPALRQYAQAVDTASDNLGLYKPASRLRTPTDLPQPLIAERISTLAQIYDFRFDASAYIELQELEFATRLRRDINKDLFTGESRSLIWEEICQPEEDLLRKLDAIDECASENASEAAAFGDGPTGSARQDALGKLDEKEILYVLKLQQAIEPGIEEDELDYDVPY